MKKKIWSIVLLCLILTVFLLVVDIGISGVSIVQSENTEIDTSNDNFPLSSLVAGTLSFFLNYALVFIIGMISAFGFFCSRINMKIAQNAIIRRISTAFLYVYSVVLIVVVLCIAFVFPFL